MTTASPSCWCRAVFILVFWMSQGCAAPTQQDTASPDKPLTPLPSRCELPTPVGHPAWLRDGVGYQIWVRSFADSDGDGVGDLRGIIERLDYLNDGKPGGDDLGVTVLWLSPIFPSPSDHGYDATDYRSVNPDYGSAKDLEELLAAAHARGIHVMLDLVLNHCSSQHPWFQAAKDPKHPKRAWFSWRDSDPGWTQPWGKSGTWHKLTEGQWYYGLFWQGMPDLNVAHAPVAAELEDIAVYWVQRGVDGYRLDAARYLVETGPGAGQSDTPETHEFWRKLRKKLASVRPDVALVGEVWTKAATVATYLNGQELHAAFDFDACAGLRKGVELQSPSMWRSALCNGAAVSAGLWSRFGGNHDMPRLADTADDLSKQKLALATVLFSPGVPWIYQGDELGLPSGPDGGDRRYRLPLPWSADGPGYGFTKGQPWMPSPAAYGALSVTTQRSVAGSLLNTVREMVRVRSDTPVMARGAPRVLELDESFGLDVDGDLRRWPMGPEA